MHRRQQIATVEFTKETVFENRMEFSNSGIYIVWGKFTVCVYSKYFVNRYIQYIKNMVNSKEKTLMLGKNEGRKRRG